LHIFFTSYTCWQTNLLHTLRNFNVLLWTSFLSLFNVRTICKGKTSLF
jgi:hypothetical protein